MHTSINPYAIVSERYFLNRPSVSFSKTYLTNLDSFFMLKITGIMAPIKPMIIESNVTIPSTKESSPELSNGLKESINNSTIRTKDITWGYTRSHT